MRQSQSGKRKVRRGADTVEELKRSCQVKYGKNGHPSIQKAIIDMAKEGLNISQILERLQTYQLSDNGRTYMDLLARYRTNTLKRTKPLPEDSTLRKAITLILHESLGPRSLKAWKKAVRSAAATLRHARVREASQDQPASEPIDPRRAMVIDLAYIQDPGHFDSAEQIAEYVSSQFSRNPITPAEVNQILQQEFCGGGQVGCNWQEQQVEIESTPSLANQRGVEALEEDDITESMETQPTLEPAPYSADDDYEVGPDDPEYNTLIERWE